MRNRLALLLPLTMALVACSMADAAPGPSGARTFAASGFRGVALRGSDDVVIRVGPAFSVRATGPQAVLDNLVVEVRDDTLYVTRRSGWRWNGKDHARVDVTLPALSAAAVAGSGDMMIGPFRSAAFSGNVHGSGDLTLERVETDRITLALAGSGDLRAHGRAGQAKLSVAGSGDLDASGLVTGTLSASVAGSGDLVGHATGNANLSVAGSGDVAVHGTDRCTVSKVGTGDASCSRA